jgi:hypothetical protein
MTTRSGTVQYLHISEFGYICQKFPDKAEEIVTGAMNSVHDGGMVSIESTAAGREGYFYDFCMEAEKNRKENRELTTMDFKIFFFPWWIDKRYTLEGVTFPIPTEFQNYFQTLKSKHGIELSDGQKQWYVKKKQFNKDKMSAEFPSTLDEAFSVSVEGSYYAKEMSKVYLSRRISHQPLNPSLPVDTWWDLGMNDDNVIIFVQLDGPWIRIIDEYHNHGEGLAHYIKVLEEKGYRYGRHILPHDVEVRDLSLGKTRKLILYELGLTNVTVAPKLLINDGIERVRGVFHRFQFDEEKAMKVYDALANYRKEWDAKLGVFKDKPRHDQNSHIADAIRTGAVTYRQPEELDDQGEPMMKERESSFFG